MACNCEVTGHAYATWLIRHNWYRAGDCSLSSYLPFYIMSNGMLTFADMLRLGYVYLTIKTVLYNTGWLIWKKNSVKLNYINIWWPTPRMKTRETLKIKIGNLNVNNENYTWDMHPFRPACFCIFYNCEFCVSFLALKRVIQLLSINIIYINYYH